MAPGHASRPSAKDAALRARRTVEGPGVNPPGVSFRRCCLLRTGQPVPPRGSHACGSRVLCCQPASSGRTFNASRTGPGQYPDVEHPSPPRLHHRGSIPGWQAAGADVRRTTAGSTGRTGSTPDRGGQLRPTPARARDGRLHPPLLSTCRLSLICQRSLWSGLPSAGHREQYCFTHTPAAYKTRKDKNNEYRHSDPERRPPPICGT